MYKVQSYKVGDTLFEACGPQTGQNFNAFNITPSPTPYIRVANDSTATVQLWQGQAKLITSDTSGTNLINIDYSVPDAGWTLVTTFAPGQTDFACPYFTAQNHLKFTLSVAGYGFFFARLDYK